MFVYIDVCLCVSAASALHKADLGHRFSHCPQPTPVPQSPEVWSGCSHPADAGDQRFTSFTLPSTASVLVTPLRFWVPCTTPGISGLAHGFGCYSAFPRDLYCWVTLCIFAAQLSGRQQAVSALILSSSNSWSTEIPMWSDSSPCFHPLALSGVCDASSPKTSFYYVQPSAREPVITWLWCYLQRFSISWGGSWLHSSLWWKFEWGAGGKDWVDISDTLLFCPAGVEISKRTVVVNAASQVKRNHCLAVSSSC